MCCKKKLSTFFWQDSNVIATYQLVAIFLSLKFVFNFLVIFFLIFKTQEHLSYESFNKMQRDCVLVVW